jgi:hypothetical protein
MLPTLGSTFWPDRRKNSAAGGKKIIVPRVIRAHTEHIETDFFGGIKHIIPQYNEARTVFSGKFSN